MIIYLTTTSASGTLHPEAAQNEPDRRKQSVWNPGSLQRSPGKDALAERPRVRTLCEQARLEIRQAGQYADAAQPRYLRRRDQGRTSPHPVRLPGLQEAVLRDRRDDLQRYAFDTGQVVRGR